MRMAIIGAGFSGLALSYYFSDQYQIILFDAGGGASRISAGLLHPYPGKWGRRSWKASEGIEVTKELLQVAETTLGRPVADYSGIFHILDQSQREIFLDHQIKYGDIVMQDRGCIITSGITVNVSSYLDGLLLACQAKGVQLIRKKISSFDDLKEYDQIIIAAGAGTMQFKECQTLKLKAIKGQILTCRTSPFERSIIANGYLAKEFGECHLGATYERTFNSDLPCMDTALKLLAPKLEIFSALVGPLEILACRAGVRVMMIDQYIPFIGQVSENRWVMTGMGSRGLLYHAYLAKCLVQNRYTNNHSLF